MKNDRNFPAALTSLVRKSAGAAGGSDTRKCPRSATCGASTSEKKAYDALMSPRRTTSRRWTASTKSAVVKINLRSLTCLERKKRNSVDADSVAVSSFVGTRPMARARARNDSPENSPEIRRLAMAQPPLLRARRRRPDVWRCGDVERIRIATGVRVSRTAAGGRPHRNDLHGCPQRRQLW